MKIDEIKNIKKANNIELEKINKKCDEFSKIRILIVIIFIIFLICGIILKQNYYYYFLTICVIIFASLGAYYSHFFKRRKRLDLVNSVLDEYLYRDNGKWMQFSDNGVKYLKTDKEHDLDIFGKKSLYQFICSAKTPSGKEKLADMLKNGTNDIELTQKEVEKFSDLDVALKYNIALKLFQVKANDYNLDDLIALKSLVSSNISFNKKSFIGLILLPIIFILGICLSFINISFIGISIITLLLQFAYTRVLFSNNEIFTYETASISSGLRGYKALFKELGEECDYKSLNKVNSLCDLIASRKNIFVYLFGNMFFLDFFILLKMKQFSTKQLDSFFNLIDNLALKEAYLSLANINIVLPDTTFPKLGESFVVKDVRHPLIKNPIGNDFTLNGVVILTGSNMSGKTTFMRSLGINYVLFMAGGAVAASHYEAPRLSLYTSLRVNDLTLEGISTFYAELKRIKNIIDGIKRGEKIFALIDEIFKGTNASDRLVGATRVIEKLLNQYAIISTHDFELCKIENVLNYHFNEDYDNDKIKFDYKIKEGQCKTTNGKYLMESIGLE